MPEQITLYSAKLCPFAHRVEIALKEAGLPYNRCEVDFFNKPEWYLQKVNPAGKVPAIAYGGPQIANLEDPSPESTKLFESLILVEFINDLITPTGSTALLPQDPVLRAKARFVIESAGPKLVSAYFDVMLRGEHPKKIVDAIEILQGFLPELQQVGSDEGDLYLLGRDRWSMADAACVTILARAEVALENDLGAYDAGEGKKEWARVMHDERFARFRKWFADVKKRKSFSETWHREFVFNILQSRYPALRAKRLQATAAGPAGM